MARSIMRSGKNETPAVRISAGTWTMLGLLQRIQDLTGSPPDINIQLLSTEHHLNIARREAVIGIRERRPTEDGLAGRQLKPIDFAPYRMKTAPDEWIRVVAKTNSALWVQKHIKNTARYEVTSPRNSLDLALAGVGIAVLPTFIGDVQPTLIRHSPPIAELSHNQWVVMHEKDRSLPEVRQVLDRIYHLFDRR
ncbi:MAG: hypothetical protein ABJO27_24055 [Pseudoruegeria sp.]